jgi:hypothetical protein
MGPYLQVVDEGSAKIEARNISFRPPQKNKNRWIVIMSFVFLIYSQIKINSSYSSITTRFIWIGYGWNSINKIYSITYKIIYGRRPFVGKGQRRTEHS